MKKGTIEFESDRKSVLRVEDVLNFVHPGSVTIDVLKRERNHEHINSIRK
jgi:hypothetical protein